MAAIAALVVLAAGTGAAGAAASRKPPGRVTFGVEPASGTGADGRPYFSFSVTPGATLFDHVAVLNYSKIALSLQLYAADAVETATGGFGLSPGGARPTGVGAWITLPASDATVVVPAESAKAPGEVVVPLTVRVPDTATPGDHAAGIVASLRTIGKNASGQNVVLIQRIGTRVYVRVAGALHPKLTVSGLAATYHGTADPIGSGSVSVRFTVTNAGNENLSLAQNVSVRGLFGSRERVAAPGVPFLLPGSSVRETVKVPGVWPEFLVHPTVSVTPSALTSGKSTPLPAVSDTTTIWAVPWLLIVLVVLALFAGAFAWRWRARRAAAPAVAAAPAERRPTKPVGVGS